MPESLSSRNNIYMTSKEHTSLDRSEAAPGARFSKAPDTFRARKAIFSSSVSKNG